MARGLKFVTSGASAAIVAGVAVAVPAAAATAVAPGAPGALSYFDLARKDCVGMAATQGSKVWYTVADRRFTRPARGTY